MSDLIDRQAAIDTVHRAIFDFFDICSDDDESPITYKDEQLLEINKAITTQIRKLPSAEPEIIRCKDCKYSEHYRRDERMCSLWDDAWVFDDGFCNHAKRGEDN